MDEYKIDTINARLCSIKHRRLYLHDLNAFYCAMASLKELYLISMRYLVAEEH